MTWGNNHARMSELPSNWDQIRRDVFERDGWQCTWKLSDGRRCPEPATDCDHIGDRLDHSKSNLRALCGPHHDLRTSIQGRAAWAKKKAAAKLPSDEHPGWA